jgi:Reverse transcriptase (RNA-dependent DNA polymerase)
MQEKLESYSAVIDVKEAYSLKSEVKVIAKQIYMKFPDGRLVKLKKYLYGLKQAGYQWQQNVTQYLKELEYIFKSPTKQILLYPPNAPLKEKQLNGIVNQLIPRYGEVTLKDGDLIAYL